MSWARFQRQYAVYLPVCRFITPLSLSPTARSDPSTLYLPPHRSVFLFVFSFFFSFNQAPVGGVAKSFKLASRSTLSTRIWLTGPSFCREDIRPSFAIGVVAIAERKGGYVSIMAGHQIRLRWLCWCCPRTVGVFVKGVCRSLSVDISCWNNDPPGHNDWGDSFSWKWLGGGWPAEQSVYQPRETRIINSRALSY